MITDEVLPMSNSEAKKLHVLMSIIKDTYGGWPNLSNFDNDMIMIDVYSEAANICNQKIIKTLHVERKTMMVSEKQSGT